jgi:formylglycine-generating enzyme required for sulfatase activity
MQQEPKLLLSSDPLASRRVEVAVVTFDSQATVAEDFVITDQFDPPQLGASDMALAVLAFHATLGLWHACAAPPRFPSTPAASAQNKTWTNPADGLTYVWIPPGKFTMGCSPGDNECNGNEKLTHEVTITKGFWMGQTEVTQAAYQKVMGTNPGSFKGENLPVESIA